MLYEVMVSLREEVQDLLLTFRKCVSPFTIKASVSLQRLDVMKRRSESPAGLHAANRPRQLELFVWGEAELLQQD